MLAASCPTGGGEEEAVSEGSTTTELAQPVKGAAFFLSEWLNPCLLCLCSDTIVAHGPSDAAMVMLC